MNLKHLAGHRLKVGAEDAYAQNNTYSSKCCDGSLQAQGINLYKIFTNENIKKIVVFII